ncbi:Putative transcription factor kapC [Fulvia fulva]|uniref:Putative transcription factor kapC n=1 Tax=Passalora fulva TaxID=5499 RepID=A0A9Q8PD15_PASFU|nr:Putative transcription factor kapC [Fulvia fulva]KAK4619659.1 putative transcription factor kapC [Fulvia fulva]KAK4620851.1 putative transcription factor kapC [Fulvia fulva]UJO20167.1 Putative transcription factor kapC [Fulvia fulva]WPV17352.1 Putative transcription factor kapC [Fulvia fulva]WPV32048.1 Putative transcription factor kapC [Fulvia fulva]
MQHARAQPADVEMSLREQLLSEATGSAPPPYPPAPIARSGHVDHPYPHSDSQSPHDHHLDPSVTGQQVAYAMSGGENPDDGLSPEARKGKRELSTSKRAAQNRAAQRAFRQRKEGYIKKLEEQVKDYQNMEQNYKALQNENYQLREYILSLQSRMLENQSDFPPAPPHINLSSGAPPPASQAAESSNPAEQQMRRDMDTRPPPPAPVVAREDPSQRDGLSQLQAAAASAQHEARAQASPYGLGNDYPQQRPDSATPANHDAKPAS